MKWQADSKILLQGVHHPLAPTYIRQMQSAGARLVAGVSAGHGGETVLDLPVFDLVEEAVAAQGMAETTVILNPPYRALDAGLEAMAAGVRQLVVVSGGVPPLDMIQLLRQAKETNTFVLGSSSQGVIRPGQFSVGTLMPHCYRPGAVGLLSHWDDLTDEVADHLTRGGWGQSWGVSLGTDPVLGSSFEQWLQMLEEDDGTEIIVLLGHLQGQAELRAADYITSALEKPVIAYLAGKYGSPSLAEDNSLGLVTQRLSVYPTEENRGPQALALLAEAQIPVVHTPWDLLTALEALKG
ncbi:MAG: CoA-binding protein [Cyanobacteriota bacterium]|nr:CoA-binding protein [Cyanobacteriota bacterium]